MLVACDRDELYGVLKISDDDISCGKIRFLIGPPWPLAWPIASVVAKVSQVHKAALVSNGEI